MRFMVMHKVDAKMEAGGPPDPQIIQNMGALVQESLKSGVFITGAGLHRSEKRVRIRSAAGKCQVSAGPYAGENELLASYALIKVRSQADAVAQAQVYALAEGECEVEVGPVVEPWDLGIMPKPAGDIPLQVLLLTKANAAFERGEHRKEAHTAALRKLAESLGDDGALLATGTLTPSSKGARAKPGSAKRTWVDGPFAESKELIAGFSILELPAMPAAIAWAERYATILSDAEVDVRGLRED
ncbi:MAG TPA: YciI family protein [Polyangiaceae bacterium]